MKKILFILLCSSIFSIALADDIDTSSAINSSEEVAVIEDESSAVDANGVPYKLDGTYNNPYLLIHGAPVGYSNVFQFLYDIIGKLPLDRTLDSFGIN